MNTETLDKIHDDARSSDYHARIAREWGTDTGREVRKAIAVLVNAMPLALADAKHWQAVLAETVMDAPITGGLDADAYYAALTEGG